MTIRIMADIQVDDDTELVSATDWIYAAIDRQESVPVSVQGVSVKVTPTAVVALAGSLPPVSTLKAVQDQR